MFADLQGDFVSENFQQITTMKYEDLVYLTAADECHVLSAKYFTIEIKAVYFIAF